MSYADYFPADITIPADSIIRMTKVDASPYKGTSFVDLLLVDSPNSDLVKKPKRDMKFRVSLSEINEMECEVFNP